MAVARYSRLGAAQDRVDIVSAVPLAAASPSPGAAAGAGVPPWLRLWCSCWLPPPPPPPPTSGTVRGRGLPDPEEPGSGSPGRPPAAVAPEPEPKPKPEPEPEPGRPESRCGEPESDVVQAELVTGTTEPEPNRETSPGRAPGPAPAGRGPLASASPPPHEPSEFSVAAIRGAELKLKGDESCPEASPRLTGAEPSPLSNRAHRPASASAGAPALARAATLSSPSSLKAASAVRDWLPDDDILAGRLPALGGALVSNLGKNSQNKNQNV
ncbi:Triple functional domain protein [Frankliniella fusca]|uniref:Triple functional domain protein n=1 Tax=Frankliniella fusca TaxID=407009 RepID=A0AAE1GPT6_9NEOP|nr:Triple functional domain protein [Frankliniella fusca]